MGKNLVVIGDGMVGHKFLERMVESKRSDGATANWNLITFCEEPRVAYDRVNLSSFFSGKTAADLTLVEPGFYQDNNVKIYIGDKAVSIDRAQKQVTSANGVTLNYDKLVIATGSYPFVPPIKGQDTEGTFVYRTIDDLESIAEYGKNCKVGVVVGGGLLGLECANALKNLGVQTHVIEFMPRLMPVQVDDGGGAVLRKRIEDLGVSIHTSKSTTEIVSEQGKVHKMLFADGSELQTDMIVFSAGIRPRDELAKACELEVGERGGIVVNDFCQTSDSDIYAIGECALYQNRIYGLVAPGYTMAEVAADHLRHSHFSENRFTGADMSTKLKLLGVDVASFGDAFAKTPGSQEIVIQNAVEGTYKKLVINSEATYLLGGILVGDASAYGMLHQMVQNQIPLPPHPEDLILPQRTASKALFGVESLPDTAQICSCNNVSKGAICSTIRDQKLMDIGAVKQCTQAGTGCGGCVPLVTDLLKDELKKAGVEVKNHLCEHFAYSRQELYHLVRTQKIVTFDELLHNHGKGHGCEICKPAVASILASAWNDYILNPPHAGLQDTNDAFLANIQKDGSYSVIPRIPGGEITPDGLITLGQIAKDFGLYTKITGAQRIDMFGARVDQLPHIWKRLVDAGFESGHAYGKALNTTLNQDFRPSN